MEKRKNPKSPKNNPEGRPDADELERAKSYLNLLFKYRPRTERETRERLEEKGYSQEVITGVIDWAKRTGNVDDRSFAKYFVEDRKRNKPTGRSGLYRKLLEYGVDKDTANEVLDETLGDYDQGEKCRELAEKRLKRYKGDDVEAKYRKTSSFLIRRGFSRGEVKRTLKELLFNDE
ncbi:MAG: regulatory protein RecX [Candidatus Acetothermia bacterium]